MTYVPRLQTQYKEEIAPALVKQFEYKSAMQAPKITKICLNQGCGKAVGDRKMVDQAVEEMTMIAGQKAVKTMSTKDTSFVDIVFTAFCPAIIVISSTA